MWELDYIEGWAPKNWCFQTVVLEETLESLLDCKEISPVNPKGNQPWIFIGRTDAEAETPLVWPPDVEKLPIGKDPDTRKDWKQEEKGTTEDEIFGWASPTRWTWVWVNSGRWWWTGRPGVLRFMGLQRVGHNWATELNWMNIQGWFPLGLTGLISLLSKGLSRVFSSATIQKHQFFGTRPSLWSKSHTQTWLLEKPLLWLYRPLSGKEKVETVTDFIFLGSKFTAAY